MKTKNLFTMEGFSRKGRTNEVGSKFRQEIHSKVIRAGKRTYFFDVKSTRNEEFYLTITESKKCFENEGKFMYEKHKIFLYKEDFDKFIDSLQDIIDYIKEKQPYEREEFREAEETIEIVEEELSNADFTDIRFEDLNSK